MYKPSCARPGVCAARRRGKRQLESSMGHISRIRTRICQRERTRRREQKPAGVPASLKTMARSSPNSFPCPASSRGVPIARRRGTPRSFGSVSRAPACFPSFSATSVAVTSRRLVEVALQPGWMLNGCLWRSSSTSLASARRFCTDYQVASSMIRGTLPFSFWRSEKL